MTNTDADDEPTNKYPVSNWNTVKKLYSCNSDAVQDAYALVLSTDSLLQQAVAQVNIYKITVANLVRQDDTLSRQYDKIQNNGNLIMNILIKSMAAGLYNSNTIFTDAVRSLNLVEATIDALMNQYDQS